MSDHMLIFMDPIISLFIPRNCKFRFKNAWLCESKCGEVIQKGWLRNPMGSIQDKIKTCGKVLQDWGNSVIGNFHQYILILEKQMAALRSRCKILILFRQIQVKIFQHSLNWHRALNRINFA